MVDAGLKAVEPVVEVLNIEANIAVRKLHRLTRALDLESFHGAAAMVRRLRAREHPLRNHSDL